MGSQTDKKINNYKLKEWKIKIKLQRATKDLCIPIHSDGPPKAQPLPEIL